MDVNRNTNLTGDTDQPPIAWGAVAMAAMGGLTAYVLDEQRKRKQAEAMQKAEIEMRAARFNAEQEQRRAEAMAKMTLEAVETPIVPANLQNSIGSSHKTKLSDKHEELGLVYTDEDIKRSRIELVKWKEQQRAVPVFTPTINTPALDDGVYVDRNAYVSKNAELWLDYGVWIQGSPSINEFEAAYAAVIDIGKKFAEVRDLGESGAGAFRSIYLTESNTDEALILRKVSSYTYDGNTHDAGAVTHGPHLIEFANMGTKFITLRNNLSHELAHAFFQIYDAPGSRLNFQRPSNNEGGVLHLRPDDPMTRLDDIDKFYGYYDDWLRWQFGNTIDNWWNEELADMFLGWVYNSFSSAGLGPLRQDYMNQVMNSLLNVTP